MPHHIARWATVAVAASAAITLAACSTSGATGGSGSGDGKTLTITWQSDAKPALEAVIKDFEKANPGVTVKANYAAPNELQQTMRVQLASGTYSDVFWVWPGNGNVGAIDVLAPAKYLADLSDQPWVKQMPTSIRDSASVGGKTYGLMLETTSYGAMYNNEAMKAAGLEIPDTWDKLLQFCSDARAKGKVAFSLGGTTNYETQNIPYTMTPQLVQGDDPGKDFDSLMKAGKTTFAKSGWLKALTMGQEMIQKGCFNDGFQGVDVAEANRLWATGDALGRLGIGVYIKQIQTTNTFTLAPVPTTDNPDDNWMGYAAFGGAAVNAKAKNLDLAKKFVAFLGTPKENALYVDPTKSNAQGTVPVITDPANPPQGQFAEEMLKMAKAGKTAVFPDQNWPNPEVQANMYTSSQDMYNGKKTPEQVLADMQAAYDKGAAK
jgi:raffinose/stachyose/melibiose transport system substrate-binding protein